MTTICATCGLQYDGDHPTFLGGSEPRKHATCEYCNGRYGPSERAWWIHTSNDRHRIALRLRAASMAHSLDRLPVLLPHYTAMNKAREEGAQIHFDLAAEPSDD